MFKKKCYAASIFSGELSCLSTTRAGSFKTLKGSERPGIKENLWPGPFLFYEEELGETIPLVRWSLASRDSLSYTGRVNKRFQLAIGNKEGRDETEEESADCLERSDAIAAKLLRLKWPELQGKKCLASVSSSCNCDDRWHTRTRVFVMLGRESTQKTSLKANLLTNAFTRRGAKFAEDQSSEGDSGSWLCNGCWSCSEGCDLWDTDSFGNRMDWLRHFGDLLNFSEFFGV